MKRPSMKERIYTQYQVLKNEVAIDSRKGKSANETRKTIKWRSKGY